MQNLNAVGRGNPMMLCRFICLGAAAAILGAVALAAPDDPEVLSRLVANIESLHRITATPHRMADSTATSCRVAYNTNIHEGDVAAAYCHVYVTPDAREPMASGMGAYPRGSSSSKPN